METNNIKFYILLFILSFILFITCGDLRDTRDLLKYKDEIYKREREQYLKDIENIDDTIKYYKEQIDELYINIDNIEREKNFVIKNTNNEIKTLQKEMDNISDWSDNERDMFWTREWNRFDSLPPTPKKINNRLN